MKPDCKVLPFILIKPLYFYNILYSSKPCISRFKQFKLIYLHLINHIKKLHNLHKLCITCITNNAAIYLYNLQYVFILIRPYHIYIYIIFSIFFFLRDKLTYYLHLISRKKLLHNLHYLCITYKQSFNLYNLYYVFNNIYISVIFFLVINSSFTFDQSKSNYY